MPKNIRQRFFHAIQTTFRSLNKSRSSKITFCCSVKKPNDYACVSYQRKQTSTKDDYIDLSECYSSGLTYLKDSGIDVGSNEGCQPLHSTRLYSNDSLSFSSFSNLSSIPHQQMNTSNLDVTMQQSTNEYCRCQCHHYMNNKQLIDERNRYSFTRQRQIKTKIYPFIF